MLVALLTMDILDGDFAVLSVLDVIKIVLYVMCFALLAWKGRK